MIYIRQKKFQQEGGEYTKEEWTNMRKIWVGQAKHYKRQCVLKYPV